MTIDIDKIKLEESWKEALRDEFVKPYFAELKNNLLNAKNSGSIIYPPMSLLFNAFYLTPFSKVKVVLLGQDPYHNKGQAMGLSFSVPSGILLPPSLKNIYKELENDLNIPPSTSGDLSKWAKEGVLLLNSILSVEENKPQSHAKFGWQEFTDAVISKVSKQKEGIVFLLWGNYAKSKEKLIDKTKHYILTAPHPSPLARGAFFGCKHFSKTNKILQSLGKEPINWRL
ncbi:MULTISPECIES: uracil-DNA glycosylase [Helicobacter]|uniref:Uracil-DNA glycosylase n=1 Tax=Helicobacter ibis TaxID=2962633 RepID=A0ABT4VCZ9_9HELI|nr:MULTISPECIES: uracil-DNA glycosylase [Helicobacter]MDA3967349.1 uracil-DNA glycosylase [Helicobacter sp. WB40]MDA3968582.1 uracil-DNA glycosylase [Helicobacter ibis]